MPIRREFIPWDRPILPAAAEWLLARFRNHQQADMRQAIIVVPGRRAGRRLLEILVTQSETLRIALSPPTITTEGSFPELLYDPKRPFANLVTQQLAWAQALAATPLELQRRIVPHPPPADAHDRWLAVGDMLRRQHLDLAADGLSFTDVVERGNELEDFDEAHRWEALAAVQARYHTLLDSLGLWDVQSARLFAIKHREPQTDQPIFLLGTVDLNLALRQMLDCVAGNVTALIAAPPEMAETFDSHGCLQVAYWRDHMLPIPQKQIVQAAGPSEQAEQVASLLCDFGERRRAEEITIGVTDERLVPQLLRRLEEGGVPARWGVGRKLSETLPYRFLAAVADYWDEKSFESLAALVRHPDLYAWIQHARATGDAAVPCYLANFDRYFAEHFPRTLTGERLGDDSDSQVVQAVLTELASFLSPLPESDQTVPLWCAAIRELLAKLYSLRPLSSHDSADHELIEAGRILDAALSELEAIPLPLRAKYPLREMMPLLLEPYAAETIPPPAAPHAVEILGWLDLALDDAPALVVTTFNEGFVPKSHHADCFLPNRLREHLGLVDNARRYARDAYAAQVLLAAREDLAFVVGQRDAEGNPLAPSRLLFARPAEEVVGLALRMFGKTAPAQVKRSLLTDHPAPNQTAFEIPLPREVPTWDDSQLRITHFRSYLACPYRFYLKHVLRLRSVTDAERELPPNQFGNLLHDVLQQFGANREIHRSEREAEIDEYLNHELNRTAEIKFGKHRRGAINVQIEQSRKRLQAFARWQATRSAEGWEIAHVEQQHESLHSPFKVDDRSVTLIGRIDRIDWHAASATWQILDYKTSDKAESPDETHRRQGEWLDLQLPLYRHLAASIPFGQGRKFGGKVQMGYVKLPKDVTAVGLALGEWSESDLESADETARQVIRSIRRRSFWPLNEMAPRYDDELAAICQTGLLERQVVDFSRDEENEE